MSSSGATKNLYSPYKMCFLIPFNKNLSLYEVTYQIPIKWNHLYPIYIFYLILTNVWWDITNPIRKKKKTTEVSRSLVVCPRSQLENGARILNPDLLGFNSTIFGINIGTEMQFFDFVYSFRWWYLELGHKLMVEHIWLPYTRGLLWFPSHTGKSTLMYDHQLELCW